MSNVITTRIDLVSFRNDPHAVQVKCLVCGSLGDPMSRNWNWDGRSQTWEPQSRHIPDCKHFTHEREQCKGVVAKFSGVVPRLL